METKQGKRTYQYRFKNLTLELTHAVDAYKHHITQKAAVDLDFRCGFLNGLSLSQWLTHTSVFDEPPTKDGQLIRLAISTILPRHATKVAKKIDLVRAHQDWYSRTVSQHLPPPRFDAMLLTVQDLCGGSYDEMVLYIQREYAIEVRPSTLCTWFRNIKKAREQPKKDTKTIQALRNLLEYKPIEQWTRAGLLFSLKSEYGIIIRKETLEQCLHRDLGITMVTGRRRASRFASPSHQRTITSTSTGDEHE